MQDLSSPSVAALLDIETLDAIKAEVSRRANAMRGGWQLYRSEPARQRADELIALEHWLDEQITAADRARDVDLEARVTITPAGLSALAVSRKAAA